MEITDPPIHPKLHEGLGRMMSFLQVGKCIRLDPEEIPGSDRKRKGHSLNMRVARLKKKMREPRVFRTYFSSGHYYIERTA